jgi:hypothetical protein
MMGEALRHMAFLGFVAAILLAAAAFGGGAWPAQ